MLGMAVSSLILVSMGNVAGSRSVAVAQVGKVMAASAVVALICWLTYAIRQRHPRSSNFADAARH
jgi:hypothetical protein